MYLTCVTFITEYLQAVNDGTSVSLAPALLEWESWTKEDNGDGTFSLRSFHGNYLSARDDTLQLSNVIGDTEKWTN